MALTDLATVKVYMGIPVGDTSWDALLNLLIPAVSDELERYCGRHFEAADYKTFVWSEGGPYLYMPEYPIIQLRRLMISDFDVLTIQNTSGDATEATVNVSQEQKRIYLNVFSGVNAGTSFVDLTGKTLATVKTDILALAKGWTVDIRAGYEGSPAEDLFPLTVSPALTPNKVNCSIPDELLQELSMIERTGRVEAKLGAFPTRHFPVQRYIFADYRAGYETIPNDLELLVNKMVAAAARAAKRDLTLKSEKLGDYSWTAGDVKSAMNSAFDMYSDEVTLWRRIAL